MSRDDVVRVIAASNEEQQMLDSGSTEVQDTVQDEVRVDKQHGETEEAYWLCVDLQVSININIVE